MSHVQSWLIVVSSALCVSLCMVERAKAAG